MNVDLSLIPQQELTRRYREARRAWRLIHREGISPLITEREYCDCAISLWFPTPIMWSASSSSGVTVIDYDRAFEEAGQ